jgi:hypothetical protein
MFKWEQLEDTKGLIRSRKSKNTAPRASEKSRKEKQQSIKHYTEN